MTKISILVLCLAACNLKPRVDDAPDAPAPPKPDAAPDGGFEFLLPSTAQIPSIGTDPALVLAAYRSGVFPMPTGHRLMGWYSPMMRGVLPLADLRVTRSLRKMTKRYEVRVDTAFDAVPIGVQVLTLDFSTLPAVKAHRLAAGADEATIVEPEVPCPVTNSGPCVTLHAGTSRSLPTS